MKKIISITLLFIAVQINAQNNIEWDGKYQLQLSDFQSNATQIGAVKINSIHTASSLDFAFQMSNVEFMFTKNFNAKVISSFKRDAASIIATDSITAKYLLNFAQYEFDLSELYARKLRKEIYDKKGTFSDVSFLQVLFNSIQQHYTEDHAMASKNTNLGQEEEKLAAIHSAVLQKINELPDFCKNCKPPKKAK
jgi:hypothetical protein